MAKRGFLRTTEGNVTDYQSVEDFIDELAEEYDIIDIAIDPWQSKRTQQVLDAAGYEVTEFRQGFASMSEPSKEFERLVVSHELKHDGNPVMRWMVSNAIVKHDDNGNIRPNKKKDAGKMDGVTAGIMAVGRAMLDNERSESVYNSRGIIVL